VAELDLRLGKCASLRCVREGFDRVWRICFANLRTVGVFDCRVLCVYDGEDWGDVSYLVSGGEQSELWDLGRAVARIQQSW
jgi:hypothetical protein